MRDRTIEDVGSAGLFDLGGGLKDKFCYLRVFLRVLFLSQLILRMSSRNGKYVLILGIPNFLLIHPCA